jgi:hypothetical protein
LQTRLLPEGAVPAVALRRWLHGRWALLFSHPDDFAAYGFESDRWLVHVEEAFAATDIRPLALAGRHETGWVNAVGGCTTSMGLDEIQRYPSRAIRAKRRCATQPSNPQLAVRDDARCSAATAPHVRLHQAGSAALADGSRRAGEGAARWR